MSRSEDGALSPDSLDTGPPPALQAPREPNGEPGQDTAVHPDHPDNRLAVQEQLNYHRLCRLLAELGPQAMRVVFSNIHPPLTLPESLSRPAVSVTLRRLRAQGLLTPAQWDALYPGRRSLMSPANYDPALLYLLLRSICPLPAPYPDGWRGVPTDSDTSLSADLVRLQWHRRLLVSKAAQQDGRVPDSEFRAYWAKVKASMVRLGGSGLKVKVERLERDQAVEEDAVKALKDWDDAARDLEAKELKLDKSRSREPSDLSQLASGSYSRESGTNLGRRPDRDLGSDGRQSAPSRGKTPGDKRTAGRHVNRRKSHNLTREITTLTKEELRAHERSVLLKFYRQLTESVQSDVVLPKLIQHSLLSHEEKNRINLATRNSDRMKMILEVIGKRQGNAFDKFVDAIKYKYKKLSDQLMKAKLSPLKMEKPDEKTLCRTGLLTTYNNTLKSVAPIPWHPDITVKLSDFLAPFHITDFYGRLVPPETLLAPHPKSARPRRVLLQGLPGVGRTSLLRAVTQQWSAGPSALDRYRLVVLLDLGAVQPGNADLVTVVIDQCLGPGGYVRDPGEVHAIIHEQQENVLFLLDGFENLNDIDSDIWDLVHHKLYPESSVILTTDTGSVTSALLKNFDTHLVLLGLQAESQESLVCRYAELTKTPRDRYSELLTRVMSECNTSLQTYSQNPLVCLCLCLLAETETSTDIHSVSHLLSTTVRALQKLYCHGNGLSTDDSVPDEVQTAVTALETVAFRNLLENRLTVSGRELMETVGENGALTVVAKLGVLEPQETATYVFRHRLLQEFLAARYMSRMEPEEFSTHVYDLTHTKHLHNMAVFFCGIHRFDANLLTTQELFKSFTENQRNQQSGRSRLASSLLKSNGESKLSSMSLSLECLAESEGRQDLLDLLQESNPRRISMRHRVHHPPGTLVGLAYLIKSSPPAIAELDLRLDHMGTYYEHFYMTLADAIEQNTHLLTLRLRWTHDHLLAVFLANVFGKNRSLRHLYLVDESTTHEDQVSATVWSNLWSAGNNMHHLQTLAFTNCQNPAMVTSFVRNSPPNLENWYFNSCKLDLIGAQELSAKTEKSRDLQILSLSSATLKRSDFLYVAQGLKLNKSLTELLLSSMQLDEPCLAALAEALKFHTTLRRLDLRKAALSTESCRALGVALSINQSLLEVDLTEAEVSREGARLLWKLKRDGILLTGLPYKHIYNLFNGQDTDSAVTTLPAIKAH